MTMSKRGGTLLRRELGGLMSMILLVHGRKDVPADATPIRYGSAQKTFIIVMMVLGPFEIVLVELVVPWAWLRTVLLVVAIYGVIWMFGYYSGLHTRPHYIDFERLVLRNGHLAAASVDVGFVNAARRETHEKYKGLVAVEDDVVAVPGMNGTALTLTLEPETPVQVQGRGTVRAREIRFDADDPEAALRSIRQRLAG
ncbi:hypothetical protein Lesp02_15200 [Lentzea sp. NBRC 105346]|uniref:hypothetical protein n=1 Tax=Lentzea sp. NBRC 105346 TaxID=3032205 RepID=UPI0024A2881D|nr:hypothetical protein [Lentzea sp. NBRC 105346]GLZ29330.1 hypothetical protein Lesp02_15200 [Lentzea sp. NBRC 105346]